MGIPDQFTCVLRNLYVGQEATDRTLYGTTDWFKAEKGVQWGCLLSPCLFSLYTELIMRNARLDELQARIKIARRNINNLRYADAAAAKSLQSCLTLCEPIDGRLSGSSIPGILQARILEWVAIYFSDA